MYTGGTRELAWIACEGRIAEHSWGMACDAWRACFWGWETACGSCSGSCASAQHTPVTIPQGRV